jgi:hypothetical protein
MVRRRRAARLDEANAELLIDPEPAPDLDAAWMREFRENEKKCQ